MVKLLSSLDVASLSSASTENVVKLEEQDSILSQVTPANQDDDELESEEMSHTLLATSPQHR